MTEKSNLSFKKPPSGKVNIFGLPNRKGYKREKQLKDIKEGFQQIEQSTKKALAVFSNPANKDFVNGEDYPLSVEIRNIQMLSKYLTWFLENNNGILWAER